MRLPWIKIAAVFLAIWVVAGGIMFFAREAQPTPESVIRYLADHPVDQTASKDRGKMVEKVAGQLNQLSYQERREVRMSRKLDGFFKGLTPEEQARFLDLTLPTGFKQMMDALNKMTPQKRKQFVKRALDDMKKREGEELPADMPELDANGQKMIDQGFRAFYSEASVETKMDVAPLIEQLQKNLQGLH